MNGNSTSEFTWLSGDGTQYKNFGDSFDRSLQSQSVDIFSLLPNKYFSNFDNTS